MENIINRMSGQGTNFYLASQRCGEKRPLNVEEVQWLMIPEITCMALSIELNLKAMMSYEKKDKPNIHNIEKLLKSLNGKTQAEIIKYAKYETSQFWSEIKLINNAFEDWRYIYEKGVFEFNPTLIFKLGDACQKITTEMIR